MKRMVLSSMTNTAALSLAMLQADVTAQVLGGGAGAPAAGGTAAAAAVPGQPVPGLASDPATGTVQASQSSGTGATVAGTGATGATGGTGATGSTGGTGATGSTGATGAAPVVSLVDRITADETKDADLDTRMTAVETRLNKIIDAHNASQAANAATGGSGITAMKERMDAIVTRIFGDPTAV